MFGKQSTAFTSNGNGKRHQGGSARERTPAVAGCDMKHRFDLDVEPQALVDRRLQVVGIGVLCGADASIMPLCSTGNADAPTMMIAGKAAMILEDSNAAAD
jgi:choline dehydrogenase-like flavoprotein